MAEKSPKIIPMVDLENFPEESKKLLEACEFWGCFRVLNHKIPLILMSDMKSVFRSLLDLPMEVKLRNLDARPRSGYMKPDGVNPLYESLGLYDTVSSECVDLFCAQLDASEHQRDVIRAYAKAVQELAVDITEKLAEGLGIAYDSFEDWPCQFRINKYNFTPENVGSLGVQEHTDTGFLTILQEDENVGGLEVMDKSGTTYIPVDPLPGTFLVNLGDVGAMWSNGRFRNVKHRVVCKEASIRVSIATFFLGPRSSNVEAPEELVNDENPRLYRPIALEDFRKLRLDNNLQAGEALELLRIGA